MTVKVQPKLPLPVAWLHKINMYLDSGKRRVDGKAPLDPAIALRDAALLTLGYVAMLRHSELVVNLRNTMGLRRCDIVFFGTTTRVFVRRRKNDPYGKGHTIWLPERTSSGIEIYARLRALVDYMGLPPDSPQPLFQGTRKRGEFSGVRHQGAAARFKKCLLVAIGLPASAAGRYSMHSLRRGGCTHAYANGASIDSLMAIGAWQSHAAFAMYRAVTRGQMQAAISRM